MSLVEFLIRNNMFKFYLFHIVCIPHNNVGLFMIIIPVQGKSEEGETGHFDHLCAKWKVPRTLQATHGT